MGIWNNDPLNLETNNTNYESATQITEMLNEELEDVVNENELDTSEEMEPCINQSRILSEFGSLEAFERFKNEEKCGKRKNGSQEFNWKVLRRNQQVKEREDPIQANSTPQPQFGLVQVSGLQLWGMPGAQQFVGMSGAQQMLGMSGNPQFVGIPGGQQMMGMLGAQQRFGVSAPTQMVGMSEGQQMMGMLGAQQMLGMSGAQQVVGMSGVQQVMGSGMPGAQQMVRMSGAQQVVGMSGLQQVMGSGMSGCPEFSR